jgi:hypothetical protein
MSTYDGNKAVSMTQAYDIPPYVLLHVLRGQNWPDGDSGFYRGISVPVLLLHGLKDPLVTLVEMCEIERVSQTRRADDLDERRYTCAGDGLQVEVLQLPEVGERVKNTVQHVYMCTS